MSCSNPSTFKNTLTPLAYHIFKKPLPYKQTLKLQEDIVKYRHEHPHTVEGKTDVLLLLEHRPTYTTGRRDTHPSSLERVTLEEQRLAHAGADWAVTKRGGQVTYHGPGQVVGYPLMDLGAMDNMRTKCYVDKVQRVLADYARSQTGQEMFAPHPDGHVGIFPSENTKLSSIGIHLSHRLTSHGFAINITNEPLSWFSIVTACGLPSVSATSLQSLLSPIHLPTAPSSPVPPPSVHAASLQLATEFGKVFRPNGEGVVQLEKAGGKVWEMVSELEKKAENLGDWPKEPKHRSAPPEWQSA